MYNGPLDPAPMFYSDKAWYTLSRYGNSKKKKKLVYGYIIFYLIVLFILNIYIVSVS